MTSEQINEIYEKLLQLYVKKYRDESSDTVRKYVKEDIDKQMERGKTREEAILTLYGQVVEEQISDYEKRIEKVRTRWSKGELSDDVSSNRKSYIVKILAFVLIIFAGLGVYEHFVTLPQMQANVNNTRTRALLEWSQEMDFYVYPVLRDAQTNLDVEEAWDNVGNARRFLAICYATGIYYPIMGADLYYWLSVSMMLLDDAIERAYIGNQTGPVASRGLDLYVLQRIGNISQAIKNITNSMIISDNGVDPVQQLEEKGTLTSIIDNCKIIEDASLEIRRYIGRP